MQNLTAPPRQSLTAAQVAKLLVGNGVTISSGLELLDSSNVLVSDISNRLVSGVVERNNFATVHSTCRLTIEGELAWGRDRIRPYMLLENEGIIARFNLGVFIMTTPDWIRGEDPVTYSVSGFDLLFLLQTGPSETYVVTAGTTYLAAVQSALTAASVTGSVSLDGTRQSTVLPSTMVWALTPNTQVSWLEVINDLLQSIDYRGIWVDENGSFRSGPYVTPSASTSEWTFDTSNSSTNIVGEQRTLTSDVWGAKNWWRFVRTPMTGQPIEGAGVYTVTNPSTGRTSIAALGREVRAPVKFLAAADQASLVLQGNSLISREQAISRTFTLFVDPLPTASHFDIVEFIDEGSTDKCMVSSWVINLDGSPGQWVLESVAS